jgi:hypothetical protein
MRRKIEFPALAKDSSSLPLALLSSVPLSRVSSSKEVKTPWAIAFLIALFVHLFLLGLLALSWQGDPDEVLAAQGANNNVSRANAPREKVAAYFITSAQLAKLMPQRPTDNSPLVEPLIKPLKKTELKPITNAVSVKSSSAGAQLAKTVSASIKAPEIVKENNLGESILSPSERTLAMTKNYLQRQQASALDKLTVAASDERNALFGASLSEMTPEMPRYQVKIIEDKTQPSTLNHRLDPNRRVKIGDTCYKVVNLSTQINPHGEGLGFGKPCDPVHPTKRAIDAAISHRLSQMKIN